MTGTGMTLSHYQTRYDALLDSFHAGVITEEEFERKHEALMEEYCYGDDKEYLL